MGASIAAGSQKCPGTIADLVSAPASTSITPATMAGPVPGEATTPDSSMLPLARPTTIRPTSMASPPAVVSSSAWLAARRAASFTPAPPMSRKDVTVVSSQKT